MSTQFLYPDAGDARPASVRPSTWLVGLDLGQTGDYSALSGIERTLVEGSAHYAVRALHRWPLLTSYVDIVAQVVERLSAPPLEQATLVLDQTGCGRPVYDLFAREPRLRARLIGVTITAGVEANRAAQNQWHVPKVELISTLQVALQSGKLAIARGLSESETLRRELQGYRRRITPAANAVFGTWREGAHDDLLLSLAVAIWWGETHRPARLVTW